MGHFEVGFKQGKNVSPVRRDAELDSSYESYDQGKTTPYLLGYFAGIEYERFARSAQNADRMNDVRVFGKKSKDNLNSVEDLEAVWRRLDERTANWLASYGDFVTAKILDPKA